jgi:hypothetical protein
VGILGVRLPLTKQLMKGGNKLRAEHYKEAVENLKRDPIIQKMADELKDAWAVRTDTWEFNSSALYEYHKRGGKVETHIGGPAEAIRELVEERNDQEIAWLSQRGRL